MIYGIDNLTRNQYFEWEVLRSAGIDFCFLKMDTIHKRDGNFREQVHRARNAGLVVGGIFIADPLEGDNIQAAFAVDQAETAGLDMLAILAEHWWADWRLYADMMTLGVSPCTVKKLDASRISENALHVIEYCKDNLEIPNIFATSKWFVDMHSPEISHWINDYPLWVSAFPPLQRIPTTWGELFDDVPPAGVSPYMPGGSVDYLFWECSGDKIRLPGVYTDNTKVKLSPINLNVFKGNEAEFLKLLDRSEL